MPVNYKNYPENWKTEIRPRILARAGNKCECCGLPNYSTVISFKNAENKTEWVAEAWKMPVNVIGKYVKVILTIAHLDHDETNLEVKDERLKALCQLCHLRYDVEEKKNRVLIKNNYKMSKKTIVDYEHFELIKFKFVDKKVELSYFNLDDKETTQNPKSNHYPHQKLLDALDEFKEIFADASGHLRGWNFARKALAEAKAESLKEAIKGYEEEVENHNVSGVSFIGDKMKGIQISGSFKTLLGSTGYAAPKVYFESDKISYGVKAEELLEKLRERVYAYLFLGEVGAKKKKAEPAAPDPNQTSIEDKDQQQAAEEDNPKKKK